MCGKSPLTRLQHVCLSRVKSGVKAGDLQGTVAQSSSAVCAQLDIDIHWCASSSLGKSLDSPPGSPLSIHTTSFLLVSSACSPASPAQCHWLACLFYAQLPLTASSTATLPASLFQKNCLGPRPPFSGHTFHFHSTTQAYARHSFSTYPTNIHAYVCIHMYTHCIHTHFHPYSTTHSTQTHMLTLQEVSIPAS